MVGRRRRWGFANFGAEILIIAALSWRELALARSNEPCIAA
jgi:hypothetical protein